MKKLKRWCLYKIVALRKDKIGIIGCGRSGTTYTSKVLKDLGFDVKHEWMGKNGISSWYLVSDQDKSPWGPSYNEIKHLNLKFVHQVRHPLNSISSIITLTEKSWRFIESEIPINVDSDNKIYMAMRYWYLWNCKAEKMALFTYQIEKIETELPRILKAANFKIKKNKNIQVDKKVNGRRHTQLSWKDLEREDKELTGKIIKLAQKYGYEPEV